MNTVNVRKVEIGKGIPKICVPVVGITRDDIIDAACKAKETADLVEWRADWYEDVLDFKKTEKMMEELRETLGDIPLLFTFRTLKEGGEKEIEKSVYVKLCFMQECGADIVKIAVMPQSKKDVLTLLLATEEMVREHAKCPVVTMSMSEVGVVSRICGEAFGSALTFGAVKKASAPGQLGAEELRMVLKILHDV